ncbi:MarR family winged helix-turn-helix transcriptional regulator [Pleurocapsa sp. FMAR1]|uniref:MarR family winged helix-turn-helix transcriptional regulator n=1 Tax=Pleurocapsa sp. FMAR1 TaxID=3040204 RepID=UPI0029C9B221|nr:MarR family transcriptional regulator [Pleurocapsa sp. FMAR1]
MRKKAIEKKKAVLAANETFIPTMRELARAYQAFTDYSAKHLRTLGLTTCQFDVIATLGNTDGMNMTDIASKTLVTKGTLTGIIDRLEKKGFVTREVPPDNRRSFIIVLTPEGKATFDTVFPAHIAHLKERFDHLSTEELEQTRQGLEALRRLF